MNKKLWAAMFMLCLLGLLAGLDSPTSGQILLQMPGVDDPERVKKLIETMPSFEIVEEVS